MASNRTILLPTMTIILCISLVFLLSISEANIVKEFTFRNITQENNHLNTYIVFLQKPESQFSSDHADLQSWYESFLPATTSRADGKQRVLHSYSNVITGFAARLTEAEAKAMEKKNGFISAKLEKKLPLHTTHSPNFLGLHKNLGAWKDSNFGKGVIIGVLDTGITPYHPSFSDEGVPPPPAKWKGRCDFPATACNNKLIGARDFVNTGGKSSPSDDEGHGTHTSSTAAGNFVNNAAVFGNADGTAAGMAPLAHLAMYRVCDASGCAESAILAAMDAAVGDGVDVLSLSLGGGSASFFEDSTAVGAFAATQKGIFVSCSAGNAGPTTSTLSNEAPWILTVGASTVDRSIRVRVKLGNNQDIYGESLSQPGFSSATPLPLVYPGKSGSQSAALCEPGSLNSIDVKGKIVLCERGGEVGRIAKGQVVKDAGGAGMILMNDKPNAYSTLADAHVLPASHVSYNDGLTIKAYINSASAPTAEFIFEGTILGVKTAPMVASFSSRGPSLASKGILKPDIIGPGVSILAAWPTSVDNRTHSKATFNMVSGTSMSCPHLSGIAALLKSAHPDWSPAAIKSAIMTTADSVNVDGKPIVDETLEAANILATGAGHVNPPKATDPGLVYDIQPYDYIPYLCGLGYSDKDVTTIVQHNVNCSTAGTIREAQLNYPSFSIGSSPATQTYTRTVTNVGPPKSSYSVLIKPPLGVSVGVTPANIVFTKVKQTVTYSVTFTMTNRRSIANSFAQGYLTWVSNNHSVRSPILVRF